MKIMNDNSEDFKLFMDKCFERLISVETNESGETMIFHIVVDSITAKKVSEILNEELGIKIHLHYLSVRSERFEIDGLCYFVLENNLGKMNNSWIDVLSTLSSYRIPHCIYYDYLGQLSLSQHHIVHDSYGNQGWRDDLQCSFMSSWEANVARIFNFLKIGWAYERYKIELKTHRTREKYLYTPDFTLNDGSIIEVKGFWDNNSIEVAYCISQEYPNLKIIYIDSDMYGTLEKLYSSFIPNWEFTTSHYKASNDVPLVGITQPERVPFVKSLIEHELVFLERDKNNRYDKNAVKVLDHLGNHLGFVAKQQATIYAPKIDLGMKFRANIKEIKEKVISLKVRRYDDSDLVYDIFQLPK